MRTVAHKRSKVGHVLQEYVTNPFHDDITLLALVEGIAETSVDGDDIVDVPKDLFYKVAPPGFRDNVLFKERFHPELQTEPWAREDFNY